MTKSEKWAYNLCRESFFSLFSYVNPVGKKDKELCDIIVICGSDIILISVKEIHIKPSGDDEVDYNRWTKRAIEDSIRQLNGAERFLKTVSRFKLKGEKEEIEIPVDKIFYKIALAIGNDGRFPMPESIKNNDYVNVMDEISFHSIVSELDTISDFIDYLKEKQEKLTNISFSGQGEEDLLAFYLFNEFDFPEKTYLYLDGGLYESLKTNDEYIKARKEKTDSYKWDFIINQISHNHFQSNGYNTETINGMMMACKLMAQETRYERKKLIEHLDYVINSNVRARIYFSPSYNHIIYVFLSSTFNNSEERRCELEIRCLVAAYLYNKSAVVIGIAWQKDDDKDVYDVVYHNYKNIWNERFDKNAVYAIKELGYFKKNHEDLSK